MKSVPILVTTVASEILRAAPVPILVIVTARAIETATAVVVIATIRAGVVTTAKKGVVATVHATDRETVTETAEIGDRDHAVGTGIGHLEDPDAKIAAIDTVRIISYWTFCA